MKKKKNKNRPGQHKPATKAIKPAPNLKGSRKLKTSLGLIVAVFAFILYARTVNNEYTLDDHKVIDENTVTTTGIAGIPTILKSDYWYGSGHDELRGPIYRPTSLIIYAIVWEFSPNNPHAYHFINIILYSLTCLMLFLVLCKLFNNQGLVLPFICSMLYAAHPIHTEVVNNIKSLDEILCFLFAILSIWFLCRYTSTKSKWSFALGGASFFLSLVSKETGIAFLLIIPLVIFFFSDNFKKSIIPISVLLVITTGLWLILRAIIFRDLQQNIVTETSALNNTLYAAPNYISRYATAFYILLRYVGLLIVPHPLSCDYNFAQIKIQNLNDAGAFIGILFYMAIGIYAIVNFRKKSIISFGILFFLLSLAPVSNIFFLGGSSMAERFLYIPSLGFCLVLSHFLIKLAKTERLKSRPDSLFKFFSLNSSLFLVVFGITILYSLKIFSRNKDWKDTLTIFSHDIKISKNSATANELLGNSLVRRGAMSQINQDKLDTFNLAKKYLKRALEIAPGFYDASANLGYVFLVENKADSAYLYLKEGVKFGSNNVQLNNYLGSALLLLGKFDDAIPVFSHIISLNPKYEEAYFNLASAYLGKGDANNGLLSYSKLIEINPNNGRAYYLASGILKTKGDTLKATEFINKAESLGYKPK